MNELSGMLPGCEEDPHASHSQVGAGATKARARWWTIWLKIHVVVRFRGSERAT